MFPVSSLWKNTPYCYILVVDTATWIALYKDSSVGAEWKKKERAHTGQHSVTVVKDKKDDEVFL